MKRKKAAITPLPTPVKVDSRTCFGINYFESEADALAFARDVERRGVTYNGGWFDGKPCGRDETWDHVDRATGKKLYAVTD